MSTENSPQPAAGHDEAEEVTNSHWRSTALASMANYIDAGSIVAGSTGLAMWQTKFGMSNHYVGVLGAFSSNAISAGVGALIGGRICDLYGRKRIYQYDLLVYAFGILWIIFAQNAWMLVVGYVVVGLAVGADVPASWTLIAENAPKQARGKLGSLAQVFWNIGPLITLWLALVLSPLGELGTRLVFGHLFVLALVTWTLRRKMSESARWKALAGQPQQNGAQTQNPPFWRNMSQLFSHRYIGAVVFLTVMYGVWNLEAGTGGFYLPYILRTVGGQGQAASVGLQSITFFLGLVVLAFVFMPLNDRVNRRVLFGIGAIIQTVGYLLFAIFELNTTVALSNVILLGLGGGVGQQVFFQIWSGELFPTQLRSTAQGFMFAVVRIALGIWSFFVPVLAATGFHTLAWILTGFLAVSGLVGVLFAPATAGKSLERIQEERDAQFEARASSR